MLNEWYKIKKENSFEKMIGIYLYVLFIALRTWEL